MKVRLLDGLTPLIISDEKGLIMRRVAREVFDKLSNIYVSDDINLIDFFIKGPDGGITALQIKVQLKFIESDDVIDVVKNRMSKLVIPDENDPGLSFMSMYKEFPQMFSSGQTGYSEINFWYQFTNPERLEWNGNHIYSFDMF